VLRLVAVAQLHAEQQRGVRGGVHQPGGVPDAGGAAAEQGRRRIPHQHPVAEELLAPGLTTTTTLTADVLPPCVQTFITAKAELLITKRSMR
jgi:hypothetical protein